MKQILAPRPLRDKILKHSSRNKSARARRCACAGCDAHISRLEQLNAQLVADNDRLRHALAAQGGRA